MENRRSSRSWRERMRQAETERFRFWERKSASQEAEEERIQEEIEQNQYLWAEYIRDVSAG